MGATLSFAGIAPLVWFLPAGTTAPDHIIEDGFRPATKTPVSLDGVGHFFHGRLRDLEAAVSAFIHRQWPSVGRAVP